MNLPPNTKEFSLELARQGHPLVTRDSRSARFIAYVPDVISHHQVLVKVIDEVVRYDATGTNPYGNTHWDLFLAPLGFCQGLPVWLGDVLCNKTTGTENVIEVGINYMWHNLKWPSKLPVVVETRMTESELYTGKRLVSVANKAISRAIADGDVIPTSLFTKIAGAVYNKRVSSGSQSFTEIAEEVLKDYLEGLK